MSTAALDDFMALNDQIAALVLADVPLSLNLGRSKAETIDALTKINAAVARRVGQGMSLAQAIDTEDETITPSYRTVVRLGLEGEDLSAGLRDAGRTAESSESAWYAVRFSGIYPAIICGLAYAGLVTFTLLLAPRLEYMYSDMGLERGLGLFIVRALQRTFPFWVAIPPLILVFVLIWSRLQSRRGTVGDRAAKLLAWLPGTSRAIFHQQCANFAEALAQLLESGTSLGEGLRIAAGAFNNAPLEHELRALGSTTPQGAMLSENRAISNRMPPFLRWALWRSEPAIDRPRALSMAGNLYRESARRRLDRVQLLAPVITCVVIGGGVTLLYGLTLFVPLVQMLKGLASS
jgi:type II secretory pathway component PulF